MLIILLFKELGWCSTSLSKHTSCSTNDRFRIWASTTILLPGSSQRSRINIHTETCPSLLGLCHFVFLELKNKKKELKIWRKGKILWIKKIFFYNWIKKIYKKCKNNDGFSVEKDVIFQRSSVVYKIFHFSIIYLNSKLNLNVYN